MADGNGNDFEKTGLSRAVGTAGTALSLVGRLIMIVVGGALILLPGGCGLMWIGEIIRAHHDAGELLGPLAMLVVCGVLVFAGCKTIIEAFRAKR